MNDSDVNLPADPGAFDLLGWLDTGTVARQHVTLHADQAAAKRMAEIDARLRELGYEAEPTPGADDGRRKPDAPLGAAEDHSEEIDRLLEEAEALLARWDASKAVVEVRALSADEIQEAVDAVPAPAPPVAPRSNASDQARAKFNERAMRFARQQTQAQADQRLHMIATATVSITTPHGTAGGWTFEQLKALRARPHGQQWIDRLIVAIDRATEDDVEIPRPTSPRQPSSSLG